LRDTTEADFTRRLKEADTVVRILNEVIQLVAENETNFRRRESATDDNSGSLWGI